MRADDGEAAPVAQVVEVEERGAARAAQHQEPPLIAQQRQLARDRLGVSGGLDHDVQGAPLVVPPHRCGEILGLGIQGVQERSRRHRPPPCRRALDAEDRAGAGHRGETHHELTEQTQAEDADALAPRQGDPPQTVHRHLGQAAEGRLLVAHTLRDGSQPVDRAGDQGGVPAVGFHPPPQPGAGHSLPQADDLAGVAVADRQRKAGQLRPHRARPPTAREQGQLGAGADQRAPGADQHLSGRRDGRRRRLQLDPSRGGEDDRGVDHLPATGRA